MLSPEWVREGDIRDVMSARILMICLLKALVVEDPADFEADRLSEGPKVNTSLSFRHFSDVCPEPVLVN